MAKAETGVRVFTVRLVCRVIYFDFVSLGSQEFNVAKETILDVFPDATVVGEIIVSCCIMFAFICDYEFIGSDDGYCDYGGQ